MTDLMWLWLLGCASVVAFSAMAATPARRMAKLSPWRQWRILGPVLIDWATTDWIPDDVYDQDDDS